MILWKSPVEITPEIKKEKGANYKGRDVGPFIRQCNFCNKTTTEYKTYDSMLQNERYNTMCKKCTKGTKGSIGNYSKDCSTENCKEIVYYKRKGDLDTAIKNNRQCQKCLNKELKELYKGGLHKYQSIEKQEEIFKKVTAGRKKYYEANPEKLSELIKLRTQKRKEVGYEMMGTDEARERNRIRALKLYQSEHGAEVRRKISNKKKKFFENYENRHLLSLKVKERIEQKYNEWLKGQENAKEAWLKSENKGGYSKYFNTIIGKVQGTFELNYINTLIQKKEVLPKKVHKAVKTQFGNYLPDFEFDDRYIEIKSNYTWEVCKGEKPNANKKVNNTQYLKIIETGKNIKPVEVLIFNNKKELIEKILFE